MFSVAVVVVVVVDVAVVVVAVVAAASGSKCEVCPCLFCTQRLIMLNADCLELTHSSPAPLPLPQSQLTHKPFQLCLFAFNRLRQAGRQRGSRRMKERGITAAAGEG